MPADTGEPEQGPLDARIFGIGMGTMGPADAEGKRQGTVSRTADFTLDGLAAMVLGYETRRRRRGGARSLPDLLDPEHLASMAVACEDVGDVTGAFIAKVMSVLEPGQRALVREASQHCLHPWHGNPGLMTECPECGAEWH